MIRLAVVVSHPISIRPLVCSPGGRSWLESKVFLALGTSVLRAAMDKGFAQSFAGICRCLKATQLLHTQPLA